MKKVLILLLALSLTGCSSVTKTVEAKGEVVDCVDVNHVAAKSGDTLLNCLIGTEKISVESNGILRGIYVVERKLSSDGKYVVVTVQVDKRSMNVAQQLRVSMGNK